MRTPFRTYLFAFLAFASFWAASASPAAALDVEVATRPVRRDILALYDSRHEGRAAETRLHRLAEMPLNWLGFKLTYIDVNGALPETAELAKYRGLVTWFVEPLQNANAYSAWLDAATASGLRYICLGEAAPPGPPSTESAVERIFTRLGLKPSPQFVSDTRTAKILQNSLEMAGFERPVDRLLPAFRVIAAEGPAAKVHLSARVPTEDGAREAVLIATGAAGGYAAEGYTFYYDAALDRVRWVLNPFLFFRDALGGEVFPVPDVTTLAGRRIYFSHIDGDGWNNISEIEGDREAQRPAPEVILRDVIEAHPDLPVSVGLIAGDTDKAIGGNDTARQIAEKIFALPQVEVASHTYTHPFAWKFFETYRRPDELALIENAKQTENTLAQRAKSFLTWVSGKSGAGNALPDYVAGSAGLPRAYLKQPFGLAQEVQGALDASTQIAKGKKAALYLWSGDAEPFEAAIKASREAGVRNMNGGDNRFDADFPSVFYVPPIARPVGRERQIYAANSNENTYTNNWRGPYYGQMALTETLKNTETPRRLKPFNLYYHMYSGEKAASLAAIKSLTALAAQSPVIPIKASEYAAIADDFFAVELSQVDATSWTLSKRGAMQTFRFDDADSVEVDDARSRGVIGSTRLNGALYVALDAGIEEALITLRSASQTDKEKPVTPSLVDSRWQIRNVVRQPCGMTMIAQGYGTGDMMWQTAPGAVFEISVSRGAERLYAARVAADSTGHLNVSLRADATQEASVTFECP